MSSLQTGFVFACMMASYDLFVVKTNGADALSVPAVGFVFPTPQFVTALGGTWKATSKCTCANKDKPEAIHTITCARQLVPCPFVGDDCHELFYRGANSQAYQRKFCSLCFGSKLSVVENLIDHAREHCNHQVHCQHPDCKESALTYKMSNILDHYRLHLMQNLYPLWQRRHMQSMSAVEQWDFFLAAIRDNPFESLVDGDDGDKSLHELILDWLHGLSQNSMATLQRTIGHEWYNNIISVLLSANPNVWVCELAGNSNH